MDFPINSKTSVRELVTLFDQSGPYFKNLAGKLQSQSNLDAKDPGGILDDYATIGAFLSDRDAVLAALVRLETELRGKVNAAASDAKFQGIKQSIEGATKANTDPVFKTEKLLSGVLAMTELAEGFNNPGNSLATLHSQALEFDVGSQDWKRMYTVETGVDGKTRNVASKTRLPTGLPTVYNDLSGMSFNNILLRHGYQFKDVGAGREHGEYTHRLQWYAICHANLPLKNTALQILKSMGLLLAGADSDDFKPGDKTTRAGRLAGRHLYVWEALFDCADSADVAATRKTMAWSKGTFNCPETMNGFLCNTDPAKYSVNRIEDLYYLRVLLKTRSRKRFLEGPQEPRDKDQMLDKLKPRVEKARVDRIYSQFPEKFIGSPDVGPGKAFGAVGMLVWYLKS
jgi:hypothetical protein